MSGTSSKRDERHHRIVEAMTKAELDALVCAFPANVLLLSGYWPVIGTAIAVATRDGRVEVLVPEDERKLAERGWADEIRTFQPGSLAEIRTLSTALREPLEQIARELGLGSGRIGYERGPMSEPVTYSAMNIYGASLLDVFGETLGGASLTPADDVLTGLRAVKTGREVERLRSACALAGAAFEAGSAELEVGLRETEIAALFRKPISVQGVNEDDGARADGFTFCMSGANAAEAFGAYARSRAKPVSRGDLVLVHCNSYLDGYWTDITRTYCAGEPDDRQRALYEAVLAARGAALDAIRPGAQAADVDRAARDELSTRGFGEAFKHPTGHGVGFGAIDAGSPPRLHPASSDRLEPGMVFNVEPAVYFDGYGGLRHCDMVVVTETGAEILTPFQATIDELALRL